MTVAAILILALAIAYLAWLFGWLILTDRLEKREREQA